MDSVCPALKVPHLGAGVPACRGAGVPGCRGALWAGPGRAGPGRGAASLFLRLRWVGASLDALMFFQHITLLFFSREPADTSARAQITQKDYSLRILSVGEILWDVFQDRESLGGAPLNFSASAHRLGNTVALMSAVGSDRRGTSAIQAILRLGLSTDFVQTVHNMGTGEATVKTDGDGNATFLIHRPAAFDAVDLDDVLISKVSRLHPDWIYFGTLAHSLQQGEQRLIRLIAALPGVRGFYDINLRDGHWNLSLVQRLSALASIVKLNETEAEILFRLTFPSVPFSLERFCLHWSSTYDIETLCITLGADGCAIYHQAKLEYFPGFRIDVADTVGAGDAFAAAFLHGLGWTMKDRAMFANALGAIVASRSGAIPSWTVDECRHLAACAPGESLKKSTL